MKKLITLSFLLFSISIISCDECRDTSCFSPPTPLYIIMKNADTGDDWLKSNGLAPENLEIFSFAENTTHQVDYVDQDSIFVFLDSEIGWETGMAREDYELRLDTLSIPFKYHTENVTEDCCAFFETMHISVDKPAAIDFELNIITILIQP